MLSILKLFGTGQITLPAKWRKKHNTKNFIAEETPKGLLIRPLMEVNFFEDELGNAELSFPMGMEASALLKELKKANGKIS